MDPTATEDLVLDLESASPEEQARAARRLGRRRHLPARAAVLKLAASPHPAVRAAALWAADQMGDAGALPAFLSALHDPAFEVRSAAGWGLVHVGAPAVEPVRRVAERSHDPRAVEMARLVLARIPPGPAAAGAAVAPRSREGDALAARVESGAHDINGQLFIVLASAGWLRASGEVPGDVDESLALIEHAVDSLRGHVRAVMGWVESQGLPAAPPVFARYGGRAVSEPGLVLFRELAADVNTIQTRAAALRTHGGLLPGESRESIDALCVAAHEIGALFRDVSMSATADGADERGARAPIHLPAFATRLAGALRVLCRAKGLRGGALCAPEARRTVLGDGRRLARVVDNLALNAVKYTAEGAVTAEVGLRGDFVTVRVADTGRGIAPGDLARLFEPGASDRAARAPDSYGVGLSFVARMVAQAGGRIEVDSVVGSGTTFDLWWPVLREPA